MLSVLRAQALAGPVVLQGAAPSAVLGFHVPVLSPALTLDLSTSSELDRSSSERPSFLGLKVSNKLARSVVSPLL